ncbi:MAG: TonB-dependent receptor [Pseudomonadota bacterium]
MRHLLCGAGTVTMGVAIGTSGAVAQTDEIIVTAAKREQTLQEVPIAVSVVQADTVEKAQIIDLIDLQTVVPSLRVVQLQSSSQTNFVIRGFGNGANNPGIENAVGVFIDGVFRSRSSSAILDLPTLERVEVLRGPQSTLFGKNVSVGAISITTALPQFEFGGSSEITVGNFDQFLYRGTLTGPITDSLAFRVSGSLNQRDGFYTNFDGADVSERSRVSTRAQLLWEASDTLSFRAIGEYNKTDEVCCGVSLLFEGPVTAGIPGIDNGAAPDFLVSDASDPFGREFTADLLPTNRLEGYGGSLQADWDVGFGEVTGIVSYREQSDDTVVDADFTTADAVVNENMLDLETFTAELRIASTGDGPFSWLAGAFLFNETVNFDRNVFFGADGRAVAESIAVLRGFSDPAAIFNSLESSFMQPAGTFFAPNTGVFGEYTMDNLSYSFFGQADYALTDRLVITGGISYIRDEKDVTGISTLTDQVSALPLPELASDFQFFPSDQSPFPSDTNPLDDGQLDDDQVTYTARIAYDLLDSLNTYFTYSTGWKAGAFNLSSDGQPPSADGVIGRTAAPEDVTLFEIGAKATFPGGYVNIALFDQKVENFQQNLFVGTGFSLVNAGEQSVRGFEIDGAYSPIDPLFLTFSLTYLDPEYDSFVNAPCEPFIEACGEDQVFFDASGTTPAGIHPVSLSTSATYTHDFSNGLQGFVRADYIFESNTQIVDNVPEEIASREVSLLNASMGIEFDNGLGVSIYGRNLLDDEFLQSAFPTTIQNSPIAADPVTGFGSFSGYANFPRTYGLTFRGKF